MAKRFIDTELLLNPNVRVTPTLYKLFWIGLITRTDHAGIWVKDFEMMSLLCGGKIEEEQAKNFFGEHLIDIDEGKRWFIPKFLDFQYPNGLSPNVKAHQSVIKILKKYDLFKDGSVRVNLTPSKGLQDMDKDKEEVKDKEKDKDKKPKTGKKEKLVLPFESEDFKAQWKHWKVYKSEEFNFKFKSLQSEQAALTELANKSNGNEQTAIEIMHQSMSNGWKGFFELKNKQNGKQTAKSKVNYSDDFKRRIVEKMGS